MAQIIPATPLGQLPPEVLKAYRLFKTWPDDYVIWHHLTPWDQNAPDFLIINPERRALLVKISSQSTRDVRPAAQMLLIGADQNPLGETHEKVLQTFLEKLGEETRGQIPSLILFPNLSNKQLAISRANLNAASIKWFGHEMLQAGQLAAWQILFTGKRLTALGIEHIRMHFTPESKIPASLTVRPIDEDRRQAGLTDYLLDIQQEQAVKNDLELPTSQANTAKDFQVGIINGVAGSGKTLILLYRLRLLHALYPQKRFLVLTHNRPLIRDLKMRYHRLTGEAPRNITWETFNGLCRRYWPESPETPWTNPISQVNKENLIQQIWEKYFKDSTIAADSLESELNWFKDQIPMTRQAYLTVERKGRGFRLKQEQRALIWDAMLAYQKLLDEKKSVDWGDVPRRFWHYRREGKVTLPVYDVVLIDEAQFFAPIWFDLIRRVVNPKNGHLFIVADPTQGFLGRGTSWKSLGVEARGRTHRIQRSYRTTYEILNFATLFYRRRVTGNDSEDEILEPDLMNMPKGILPVLMPVRSAQDEISIVSTEIAALHKSGFPLRDILVLHAEYGVQALIESISQKLGQGAAVDPKNAPPGDNVRVTTLNAGTGLESPLVFLVGLNHLFEREQSLRLSEDEADRLILDNTRKVYMAATRAGQRLVITYVGKVPEVIKELLP